MSLYSRIIDIQKLQQAWKQVYKNKPKEGVDGVTCEMFDQDIRQNIKVLNAELKEHQYECAPVKIVPLYKGEKVRYIGMYCMRDKVVQASIANELSRMYEPQLSKCCYAYRSGQSALQASEHIHARILAHKEQYVIKADIHSFFDYINHQKLRDKLQKAILEQDVVDLIFTAIKALSVDRDGVLSEKTVGLYQGSSIAPVLSNVYLKEMDLRIENEVPFYVRYSDDMILFLRSKEDAENYLHRLSQYLEAVGLELNMSKTTIGLISDGFEFLGYYFDENGKAVPQKAEKQLAERLEEVWLDSRYTDIETRLEKGREILTGWEQYYREERQVGSILEFVVLANILLKRNTFDADKMGSIRFRLDNPYKDVAEYLLKIWQDYNRTELMLLEYEQYQQIYDENHPTDAKSVFAKELLKAHEQYMILADEESRNNLIQAYSDMKQYQKAEKIQERKIRLPQKQKVLVWDQREGAADYNFGSSDVDEYMELFIGREDLYTTDSISTDGRRKVEDVLSPLTPDVIRKHLNGNDTIGTYVQRTNATVKYLAVDLDISKKVLLRQLDEIQFKNYLQKALRIADGIVKHLQHMGLNGQIEFSGYRGYHVWVFFEEWIPVRYAHLLSDIIETKTAEELRDGDIQMEFFPNKARVNKGKRGQCIKLPLGIHPKSQQRSAFLDQDLVPYSSQKEALSDFVRCPLKSIKKAISANQAAVPETANSLEVSDDLTEFGDLSDSVKVVLESCNLIRYLCQKARTTHYLSHFERMTILYVFGHLGEEGKDFVHKVMSFTLNYSYQTTQKFVNRCPEKPISCLKLREQYKQISAEIGCSCVFKRSKDCYPSPVLHALKKVDDSSQITIPMSRTVTEQHKEKIKEEISLPLRLQNIIERIMELRKQNRSIEKNIQKFEHELGEIFDENHTDSIEIKQGILSRRRAGDKVEWIIEL